MRLPKYFRTLAESQNYILGHTFEYGSIIDKRTEKEIEIGDSYGDPTFGLIDKNEKWALLFGHDSYLWTIGDTMHLNKELFVYEEIFEWPYDAKQISDFEVEILDDPWSDSPGIYNLNVLTKTIKKIRNFSKVLIPYDQTGTKISW